MKRNLTVVCRYCCVLIAAFLLSVAGWAGIETKTYPLQPGEILQRVLPRVQGGSYLIVGGSAEVRGTILYTTLPIDFPPVSGTDVLPIMRVTDRFSQTSGTILGGGPLQVVRLDAMGREISRFPVGGTGFSDLTDALVNSDGSLVILGTTNDRTFPVHNPLLPLSIPEDGNSFDRWSFLAKTDAAGTGIVRSTLIGGVEPKDGMFARGTIARDLAQDSSGNLYVTGSTSHKDFPVTANAYKKDPRFDLPYKESEGFLLKVDRDLRSLLYATFLGSDELYASPCSPYTQCELGGRGVANQGIAVGVGAGQQPWVVLNTSGQALKTTPGAYVAERFQLAVITGNPNDPRVREVLFPDSVSLLRLDAQGSSLVVSALLEPASPGVSAPDAMLALLSDGSPVVALNFNSMPGGQLRVTKLLPDASAASAHSIATRSAGIVRTNLAVTLDDSLWLSGSLSERDSEPARFEGITPSIDLGSDFLLRLSSQDLPPRSLWMLPNMLAGPMRATPYGIEMTSPQGLLTAVPFPGTPGAAILGVHNAAAQAVQSTVSPYEFLTLEGTGLGLPAAAPPQFDRNGNLPRVHEEVRVTLDGVASPLLSVSANAVTFIAPESLATKAEGTPVELELESGGQVVARYPLITSKANPQFFTTGTVGIQRFAAAVNQDGTVNSRENPASAGESISLYLNGVGASSSPVIAGTRMQSAGPWSTVRASVIGFSFVPQVTPDNIPWEVSYFGVAPGLASGTLQMNVQIPEGYLSGESAGDQAWETMLFASFLPPLPLPPGEEIQSLLTDLVSIWVKR